MTQPKSAKGADSLGLNGLFRTPRNALVTNSSQVDVEIVRSKQLRTAAMFVFSRMRKRLGRRLGSRVAVVACGCLAAAAQAQTALLNTGTTSSGAPAPYEILSGQAYAEEFAVGASTTVNIGQLALWAISSTSSIPSGTLTFSLYSGAFTGQRASGRTLVDSTTIVLPTLSSTTPQWVTAMPSSSWVVTNGAATAADYWLAVSFSGTTGLDLPLVTNSGAGTTTALGLDYQSSSSATFSAESTSSGWVGMQILTAAVPEPQSLGLLIAGLGALAFALRSPRA